MSTIARWAMANKDAWDPPIRMPSPFNDAADAVWISYHINKLLTETETKTREKKSMKPKVQWRCLKTDAPAPGRRYWFAAPGGPSTAMWLNATPEFNDLTSGTLAKIPDSGFTHWAPYEAPEPPPKPTPFEVWWNQNADDGESWVNSQVGIVVKPGPVKVTHWVSGPASKQIFEAGYEACAKNMAATGGAK